MDQETKDRFERIEAIQEETSKLQQALVAAQLNTQAAIDELVVTVSRFVENTDARLKRTEANLDAMIRAITADHSNGNNKKKDKD
jgi:hexokinase